MSGENGLNRKGKIFGLFTFRNQDFSPDTAERARNVNGKASLVTGGDNATDLLLMIINATDQSSKAAYPAEPQSRSNSMPSRFGNVLRTTFKAMIASNPMLARGS